MKTKHTKGPWVAGSAKHNLGSVFTENGLHVADANGYGMPVEQAEANARLIAAAPELYDVLKELTHKIAADLASVRITGVTDWARRASNAINKAEGKGE